MNTVLLFMSNIYNLNTLLTIVAIAAIVLIYKLNKDPNIEFDIKDLFSDTKTGKLSTMKISQVVALVVSTWIIVRLTQDGKMSVDYLGMYLGIWVTGYIAKGAVNTFAPTKVATPTVSKEE